jgi:hypothetical protein
MPSPVVPMEMTLTVSDNGNGNSFCSVGIGSAKSARLGRAWFRAFFMLSSLPVRVSISLIVVTCINAIPRGSGCSDIGGLLLMPAGKNVWIDGRGWCTLVNPGSPGKFVGTKGGSPAAFRLGPPKAGSPALPKYTYLFVRSSQDPHLMSERSSTTKQGQSH